MNKSLKTSTIILISACFAGACAKPLPPPKPPPPPPIDEVPAGPPEPEAIDTGKECVKAEVVCEKGFCTAKVNNSCETPVTCELDILALCKSGSAAGAQRAKARGTIPAGSEGKLEKAADCDGVLVVATKAEKMNCR